MVYLSTYTFHSKMHSKRYKWATWLKQIFHLRKYIRSIIWKEKKIKQAMHDTSLHKYYKFSFINIQRKFYGKERQIWKPPILSHSKPRAFSTMWRKNKHQFLGDTKNLILYFQIIFKAMIFLSYHPLK